MNMIEIIADNTAFLYENVPYLPDGYSLSWGFVLVIIMLHVVSFVMARNVGYGFRRDLLINSVVTLIWVGATAYIDFILIKPLLIDLW